MYIFEIPDFLSDEQYLSIYKNLPNIERTEATKINDIFDDRTNQHSLKFFISKLQEKEYDKYISQNTVLNELAETFKNPLLNNFFLKEFYFKILHSRIHDKKNFLKLLIRKNLSVKTKNNLFLSKLIYNQIYTTFEIAYLYNKAEAFPHTDGMKKILSLMLYFPDDNLTEDQINNMGTSFYKSKEFNLHNNKVKTHAESKDFKSQNTKFLTLPFKRKNLYGFIKSHKSWHSVEPINIRPDFIRKSFNINLLLV